MSKIKTRRIMYGLSAALVIVAVVRVCVSNDLADALPAAFIGIVSFVMLRSSKL